MKTGDAGGGGNDGTMVSELLDSAPNDAIIADVDAVDEPSRHSLQKSMTSERPAIFFVHLMLECIVCC